MVNFIQNFRLRRIIITMEAIKCSWAIISALEDRQKSDLDLDHDHLAEYDLRSRSDPDLA